MSEYFFTGGHRAYLRPGHAMFILALIWDVLIPGPQLRRVQCVLSLCKRRQAFGPTVSLNPKARRHDP